MWNETNSLTNELNKLNPNKRQEKKEKEESIAKKRDITVVDKVSSETAPNRAKKDVSKIRYKSKYRLLRNPSKLRIRVPK